LAKMVIGISGKRLSIYNKPVSYEGVRGRRSDNRLIQEKLGWAPSKLLSEGIEKTYRWIADEVAKSVPA
jgi:GDP-D-mannose 3',5'-epimerase